MRCMSLSFLEQVKGVEPSYLAWEASVLPMNYTCDSDDFASITHLGGKCKQKIARPTPNREFFVQPATVASSAAWNASDCARSQSITAASPSASNGNSASACRSLRALHSIPYHV